VIEASHFIQSLLAGGGPIGRPAVRDGLACFGHSCV
jgi:hypothetical protein